MLVGLIVAAASVGILAAVAFRSCASNSSPTGTTASASSVPSFFRQDAHLTCFSNGLTEAINVGVATWHGVMHWVDASGAQVGEAQSVDAASGGISSPRGASKVLLDAEITDLGETQRLRLSAPCA